MAKITAARLTHHCRVTGIVFPRCRPVDPSAVDLG
jgi:hypothetical protein